MRKKIHIAAQGACHGERTPYLVDDTGAIDRYALAYSIARRKKLTPAARERALDAVIAVRLWAKLADVNVEQSMFYGDCLSTDEVESLKYYIHLTTRELRALSAARPLNLNKRLSVAKRCDQGSFKNKLHYANDYLSFLGQWGDRYYKRVALPKGLADQRGKRLAPVIKTGKRSKRRYVYGSIADELLRDSSAASMSRIDSTPTAAINIFKLWLAAIDLSEIWNNEAIARRNRVFLDLLVKNGGRLGEVLQIKNEDIDSRNRGIRIVRRHNDPDDPRKDEPNAKTYDRLLRFDARSWADLQHWLELHFHLTEMTDTQFLIISLSRNPRFAGRPMTKRGARQQVYQACDHAKLPRLKAHDLRHGSVRDLAEEAVKQGWTQEQWRKVATYLYGWSDQSNMPMHYVGDQWVAHAAEIMERVWLRREAPARSLREDAIPW